MKSHLWAAVVLVALGACSGDPGTAPDPADILTYDPAFELTARADGGTCPDVFQEHTQVLPHGATVTWTSGIGGFDYELGSDYSAQVHWTVDGGTAEYTGLTERPGNGTWFPRLSKDGGVEGILMVGVAGAGFLPVTVSMDPMMSVDASSDDGDDWAGFAGTGRFWLRLAVQGGKGKARSVRLGVTIHLEDPADGYQTRCPGADDPPPPPPPASEYTVGGTVSGLSGTVGLLNNGGDDLSVSSNGDFTFATSLANGASYAVTVGTQPAGQTCEVGSGTGTIGSANVTDVSVTCADDPQPPPPPASEYTVGGTVSGLSGTVGLLNNGGDNLSVSSNSDFTFATSLANGASFAVTVGTQPAGQTCEVGSGTGTISSANVTDVSVTCADDPPPPPPTPAVSYADDVQPYFNSNCTGCHGGSNPQKGVDLTSYQQVMAGGDGGAIVIPGDPDASELVQKLEDGHRNQLAADIAQIRTWIQEGAQNN